MYHFKIQNKTFTSENQNVAGEEVLRIAGLQPPEDFELFLKITNRESEPIQLKEVVDLSTSGIEKFTVLRRKKITIKVDDEKFETYECLVTPSEILTANGFDPAAFYLKQFDGHEIISFKNDPSHDISLRPGMCFITCKKSPTTVAFVESVGVERMEKELAEMGYDSYRPCPDIVAFKFVVPHGRFKGEEVEIALHAPQFPRVAPHGPFIKPHLLPIGRGGAHPNGGIHRRSKPGPEWQLWSRPMNDWASTDKTIRTYLAFIRTLFDFE